MAQSAMTTSYKLSPKQIETVMEEQFGEERLAQLADDEDSDVLVAEGESRDGSATVVGVVVGGREGNAGEIRWLFVDPEHRGEGIGTRLFENVEEALRDRGVEYVQATALEANTDGAQFFERFGYERTDERQIEMGDESLKEYVYTEQSAVDSTADSARTGGDSEYPDAELDDGELTATTDDGQRVYVDRDADRSGDEAAFLEAYLDDAYTEQFGYYCTNCGSLNVSMDNMERIECEECGNTNASRSSEEYDDSYL